MADSRAFLVEAHTHSLYLISLELPSRIFGWLVTLVEHDELFFLLCLGDVVLAGKSLLCIINLSAGDLYFQ